MQQGVSSNNKKMAPLSDSCICFQYVLQAWYKYFLTVLNLYPELMFWYHILKKKCRYMEGQFVSPTTDLDSMTNN